MFKYIILLLMMLNIANAEYFKEILSQIKSNNKEIASYKEYLNSINIESRTNNLPLNPKVEYSYLSDNNTMAVNKQELIISQSFDFPTVYFLKSDIASLQSSANKFYEKEFEKSILRNAQNLLIEFIYLKKKVEEYSKRYELYENIFKTVQTKFDKGDIGILELNKSKSNLSIAKQKLNMSKISLNSIRSELVNINGGKQLQADPSDYFTYTTISNFDSLFSKLKEADYNLKALEEEKKLYDKKLTLAKSGWLPGFDIGYRQEKDNEFDLKGVRLQMSLPLFENTNKVPKAQSELNLVDLKIQAYNSKMRIEKKNLFDKSNEFQASIKEQTALVDFTQIDLNQKSYELGHISLTQLFNDNTIYFEFTDSILENEMEYNKVISELLLEITLSEL